MARPESNILTQNTGRAQSAALVVLCVLAGVQLAMLGWSAWEAVKKPAAGGTQVAEEGGALGNGGAVRGTNSASGTPGLVPPRPGELAGVPIAQRLPSPYAGASPGLMPPAPGMLAGDAPPVSAAKAPGAGSPSGMPSLPVPDPEVAELLQTVAQLRSGGETEGLLELLKAAEGMDQNHPAVLKEFALTYEEMGLADKAREYWQRIVAGGEASGGVYFSMAQQRLERLGAALPSPNFPPGPSAALSPSNFPPGPGAALTPPNMVGGIPAEPEPSGKVTQEPGAKLGVGVCRVVKDLAVGVGEGDRRTLRIPIVKVGDGAIEPSAVNVDVFFYDRVNGSKVEPTRADPPVASWVASPVDWSGEGMEPLDVTYFLPPMSAQEVKSLGRREFHGYLVKLYYQDRLQAVVAEPQELIGESSVSSSTVPATPLPGR